MESTIISARFSGEPWQSSLSHAKQVLPLIDDNEEQLANVLEKGNNLLTTELV